MRSPTVESRRVNGDEATLVLVIDEGLDCFSGHFPGYPVLPGVVQLHWAVEFAAEIFDLESVPEEIKRLKFKSVIIPPAEVELTLVRIPPNQVSFAFTSRDHVHSEGRLEFGGGSP